MQRCATRVQYDTAYSAVRLPYVVDKTTLFFLRCR